MCATVPLLNSSLSRLKPGSKEYTPPAERCVYCATVILFFRTNNKNRQAEVTSLNVYRLNVAVYFAQIDTVDAKLAGAQREMYSEIFTVFYLKHTKRECI